MLKISEEKTSFTNPATCETQVCIFADAPELTKPNRNNFLDSETVLSEDRHVHCGPVREYLQGHKSDLTTARKLLEKQINVCCVQRTKVRLAAQLLSETTSKSLEYFGRKGLLQKKKWECTNQFIGTLDVWFDVFS